MVYTAAALEKKALKAIKTHNLVFMAEVYVFAGFCKQTFYNHGLDELDSIKDALEANRINLKSGMRNLWYTSENATLQVAAYKLIGSEEEADRLSNTKQKLEHSGKDGGPIETKQYIFEVVDNNDTGRDPTSKN